jgi:hypothetical protein
LKNIPEDEFDEEDEDPLFIPFPGTTKQKKPEPYRGSDPEWQEFIKFSKDQALAKSVRGELTLPGLNMQGTDSWQRNWQASSRR